jgi:hypothetical protein
MDADSGNSGEGVHPLPEASVSARWRNLVMLDTRGSSRAAGAGQWTSQA